MDTFLAFWVFFALLHAGSQYWIWKRAANKEDADLARYLADNPGFKSVYIVKASDEEFDYGYGSKWRNATSEFPGSHNCRQALGNPGEFVHCSHGLIAYSHKNTHRALFKHFLEALIPGYFLWHWIKLGVSTVFNAGVSRLHRFLDAR
jgi:hypothetical protein